MTTNNDFNKDNIQCANESTCPICRQTILKIKLEKTRLLFEYQKSIEIIKLMHEIENELQKLKEELDKQHGYFALFCKNHNNSSNTNQF